jgi:hypothetical protein
VRRSSTEPELLIMSSAIPDRFSESLRRYAVWLLAIAVVLVFAISRIGSLQAHEAAALALGAPVIVVVIGVRQLAGIGYTLGIAGLAIAALVLTGSELEIARTLFPPAALAEATLSMTQPDATLALPAGSRQLVVEAHGKLGHGTSGAEGHYTVELERDGHRSSVSGSFERSAATVRASRRRAPSAASSHVIDIDRNELELAGEGPVHAHLANLTGSIGSSLDVRLRPALPGGNLLDRMLVALGIAALVVEVIGSRRGTRSNFGALLAASVTLALYLHGRYSPSDPLTAVMAGLIVSMLLGGALAAAAALLQRATSTR